MAGGDQGDDSSSNGEVIADLPQDHHAEPARFSDLESAHSPKGGADKGGTGGGHLELPSGMSDTWSDSHEKFTISDYLAQARSRRSMFTRASRHVVFDARGASADRVALVDAEPTSSGISPTYTSRIDRLQSEKSIIWHLNNMADRGIHTEHSHFELDTQGHLMESAIHQHDDANDGHAESLPWYTHPIQRQRWNEDHVLPHVNWGDLFFDLFYVGAGEKVTCFYVFVKQFDLLSSEPFVVS